MITGLLKRILAIHLQWCLNPISNIPLNPFYIDFNVASSESILSWKSVMHLIYVFQSDAETGDTETSSA